MDREIAPGTGCPAPALRGTAAQLYPRPERSGTRKQITRVAGPTRQAVQQAGGEAGEVAAPEEVPGNPGRGGGGEVAVLVANKEARRAVDRPRAQQVEDHARGGLAPIAGAAVRGDAPLRMERAIADIVDVSARSRKLAREVGMQAVNFRLAVMPACDAGLIGHDEDEEAGIVECLDGFPGALDPAKPLDRADITVIMVEHAVAIEKRGGAPPAMRDLAPGPRQILGHADIDEIPIEGNSAQLPGRRKLGKQLSLERELRP